MRRTSPSPRHLKCIPSFLDLIHFLAASSPLPFTHNACLWSKGVRVGVNNSWHLVEGTRPGGLLESIHHHFDPNHLKHSKSIPDCDPCVSNQCEMNVSCRIDWKAHKYTCTSLNGSCTILVMMQPWRPEISCIIRFLRSCLQYKHLNEQDTTQSHSLFVACM